jgi:hypothetical protein
VARPRNRRRSNRNKGFSGPGQRHAWGLITRGAGIRGREKRRFFNQISGIMVLSAAVAGAVFGYSLFGWLGGITGLLVAAALMGKFVVRGRYFR